MLATRGGKADLISASFQMVGKARIAGASTHFLLAIDSRLVAC